MSMQVAIEDELYAAAVREGGSRTGEEQINFWARLGRNALANPDLPVDYVAKLLLAKDAPTEKFTFTE